MQYIKHPSGLNQAVVDPEVAYIEGRIKASSLQDIQNFRRAFPFDPRKVVEYSEQHQDVAEQAAKAELIFTQFLPGFYTPQRVAEGWTPNLHFKVTGTGEYTIHLDGEKCQVESGLAGEADAVIEMDMDTLSAVLRHSILHDAEQLQKVGVDPDTETVAQDVELSDEMLDSVVGGRGSSCSGEGCGAESCSSDTCGGDGCAADAALDDGACGGDACAANVCSGDACGGAGCVAAACSGDACAADGCGGDVCGAAACGADACGAEACGVEACAAEACAADACALDATSADACAANTCAVDVCQADACAADACAVDVIPIVPGI